MHDWMCFRSTEVQILIHNQNAITNFFLFFLEMANAKLVSRFAPHSLFMVVLGAVPFANNTLKKIKHATVLLAPN